MLHKRVALWPLLSRKLTVKYIFLVADPIVAERIYLHDDRIMSSLPKNIYAAI